MQRLFFISLTVCNVILCQGLLVLPKLRQKQHHLCTRKWRQKAVTSDSFDDYNSILSQRLLNASSVFPNSRPPFLAIITESTACDTDDNVCSTLNILQQVLSTRQVDLVSLRVSPPRVNFDSCNNTDLYKSRLFRLTRDLLMWCSVHCQTVRVVLSSDYWDVACQAQAHGVHVKEAHRHLIPHIRRQFAATCKSIISNTSTSNTDCEARLSFNCLIGTSAHSLESVRTAWNDYHPDYFLVGTCYPTASHPEKTIDTQLEGPELPGQACRLLDQLVRQSTTAISTANPVRPLVLAIGGIDERNCHVPVKIYGADGVAVIRAVLRSKDPLLAVQIIKSKMATGQSLKSIVF